MKETTKAAQAFEDYYDLGDDRSLRKLAESNQTYSKRIANLMKWSTEHRWQERIIARDRERAEVKRKRKDAAIEAMNDRHALIATTQQARSIKQIEALITAQKFGSVASVQLLKYATDLERVARGAPTEHIEQSGNIAEWNTMRSAIIAVLSSFPEAKIAVATALLQLEQSYGESGA